MLAKNSFSGVWLNVVQVVNTTEDLGIKLTSIFEYMVNSRNNTLFWLEDWVGEGTLASRFPSLFAID